MKLHCDTTAFNPPRERRQDDPSLLQSKKKQSERVAYASFDQTTRRIEIEPLAVARLAGFLGSAACSEAGFTRVEDGTYDKARLVFSKSQLVGRAIRAEIETRGLPPNIPEMIIEIHDDIAKAGHELAAAAITTMHEQPRGVDAWYQALGEATVSEESGAGHVYDFYCEAASQEPVSTVAT